MRTCQHIIDTEAVRYTLKHIPTHWVVRDLSERDYGIDLMIEVFAEAGVDKHGHSVYDATGRVCYLQVKGTKKKLAIGQAGTVQCKIDKKTLLYVEKFSTPFILLRVSTLKGVKAAYYCWLQRYILEVLDKETPDWRADEKSSFTVNIPRNNCLKTNPDKISRIAARIKYIEEAADFYEKYILMNCGWQTMVAGKFTEEQYRSFVADLKRIGNLTTLLELNECQVRKEDIQTLIAYVAVHKNRRRKQPLSRNIKKILFNLELLLQDNFMRMSVENMIAEQAYDKTY